MKNIFSLFIIAFITMIPSAIFCQELDTSPNANNLNPNLDKYVGTWKWEANNKSFKMVLKKQNIVLPPANRNVRADVIYGFHQYTDGMLIVESSMSFSNNSFNDGKRSIFGGLGRGGMGNSLKGSITHLSKNGNAGGRKTVNFEIKYIDSTHIKLVSLKNPPGTKVIVGNQPDYDWSISLPQDIILTKQ